MDKYHNKTVVYGGIKYKHNNKTKSKIMEFKKKTIIGEDNNEPPKNYIGVKSDGNAYEFNYTTRQGEKIMSSNGSDSNSSSTSMDRISAFMSELESEGLIMDDTISISDYDEQIGQHPLYKTYGNKDTAEVVVLYSDRSEEKLAAIFLSKEEYSKGFGGKFDGCGDGNTFMLIGENAEGCNFLVASEYPKLLYRNPLEEIEPTSSKIFEYRLTNGSGTVQAFGESINTRVFNCTSTGNESISFVKFEYYGEEWYAPVHNGQDLV